MLKAIIFDMDGVLVDSEPVHFAANQRMLKEKFGIELPYEDYRRYIGSTAEKIWKYFREKYELQQYGWRELMNMADEMLRQMLEKEGYPAIAGAADMVRLLKSRGYRLALASSSPMERIKRNLKRLGILECFDALASGMELANPKPAPDIFLKAAKCLSVKPWECIVIEDSQNGTMAAKAADMACLGFVNPNSGNQDLSAADYLFESFENIDESFVRMVHNHCFGLPWRVLETDRLIIREMCEDDIDALMDIYEGESITRYMEGLYQEEQEREYIKSYIKNIYSFYGYGMWIVEKKDGTVIGRAGIEYYDTKETDKEEIVGELTLNKEDEEAGEKDTGCHFLGYVIGEAYQRQGYACEACRAILQYAKEELGIAKISVKIHRENYKSIGLARKLGFSVPK